METSKFHTDGTKNLQSLLATKRDELETSKGYLVQLQSDVENLQQHYQQHLLNKELNIDSSFDKNALRNMELQVGDLQDKIGAKEQAIEVLSSQLADSIVADVSKNIPAIKDKLLNDLNTIIKEFTALKTKSDNTLNQLVEYTELEQEAIPIADKRQYYKKHDVARAQTHIIRLIDGYLSDKEKSIIPTLSNLTRIIIG